MKEKEKIKKSQDLTKPTTLLGIDIGGSGIKGALVDITNGVLVSDRIRIATPQPATPDKIGYTVKELVEKLNYHGPLGIGFPARVINGLVNSASNIDKSWINTQADSLFTNICGERCYIVNDADAAGIAEQRFGAANNQQGVVMLITVGTGLGSALFIDGKLVPNTELGHLRMMGNKAEAYASDAARTIENLSWPEWGARFNEYLLYLEFLFTPCLFIIGGGVSKKIDNFRKQLTVKAEVVPAKLQNQAGIIGGALWAAEKYYAGKNY